MNKVTLKDLLWDDFQYKIDYDYDRNNDNCECGDDYCRCSTIENTRINNINLVEITKQIGEFLNTDEFTEYIINRILTACKLYDEDNWDVKICGGYYGEEIDGIYINNPALVEDWLIKIENANTNEDKLLIALECEYGYILDELKDIKSWTIETINKGNLKIGQREHYRKLDRKIVENYKSFPYPLGVCIANINVNVNGYKLIDGYHRVLAKDDSEIKIIVGRL